ncbi:Protein of unknown function DUF1644 [Macleaya cordata]|uniref:Zinc finger protein n=1 Tax=Macleaya cordata TaxID=56857 RepID=A0A200QKE8_MACCD|nr:Protein of unknown function DUF1644 [Macleaya cordata]
MATGIRGRRRFALHQYRSTPYPLPSCRRQVVEKEAHQQKKPSVALEKKDWEDATCSVCMDYPHNAVLLLCSSHDKGCRPYMCGTSYRYSNCLDQFKKAYTKVTSPPHAEPWQGSNDNSSVGSLTEKCEVMELACPLCRGQVKGMTVVEPAREYLNAKKRSCTQDNCTFVGTYKELRKHVRQEHPCARPREVDPILEQKWRRLERERERDDVLSTIRTSMPGAMVLGDYVIEGNHHGLDTEDEDGEADEDDGVPEMSFDDRGIFNFLFLLQALTPAGNASLSTRLRRLERGYHRTLDGVGGIPPVAAAGVATDALASEGDGEDDEFPVVHHRGRMVSRGRTVRRRRRRSQRRADVDMT